MTATHTTPRVDVEQLVQTELAWATTPHPRAIAERVAAAVDESSLRTTLAAALVYVVRKTASRNRQQAAGANGAKPDAAKLLGQPVCLGPRGWSSYGRLTPTEVAEQIAWQRQLADRATAVASPGSSASPRRWRRPRSATSTSSGWRRSAPSSADGRARRPERPLLTVHRAQHPACHRSRWAVRSDQEEEHETSPAPRPPIRGVAS